MYGWFFVCAGIALLAVILKNNGLSVLSILVLLIPWLAFSAFANLLYHRHVKEKIAGAQLSIKDKSKLPEFLRYEGGVHTWVTWIGSSLAVAGVLSAILVTLISNYNQRAEKRTWTEPPRIEVPAPPAALAVPETAAMPSAAALKQERLEKIRKAHPDFEKYRDDGSLAAWIKRQPGHLSDFLQKTYKEGDADSVIAILILFKNDNSRLVGAAPLPAPSRVGKDLGQTAAYRPKNKIKTAPPKQERENKSQQELNKPPIEDMVKIPRESAEVPISPEKPPPIPKEKAKTTLDIDQRFKGIKGIALNNGKVIEGQVISMGAEILKIRTKEGKVLSYSFEHEVQRFLKE